MRHIPVSPCERFSFKFVCFSPPDVGFLCGGKRQIQGTNIIEQSECVPILGVPTPFIHVPQ
jgi:hypothetical protein